MSACALLLGATVSLVAEAAGTDSDVCHVDGQGRGHLIPFADPAFSAHEGHGDHDISPEVCDGVDNDCDGEIDNAPECCVTINSDCDGLGTDLATVCGEGLHKLSHEASRRISYVTFGAEVASVTLIHCPGGPLSKETFEIEEDTSLCDLPGDCCEEVRWNDMVCRIEISY